MRADPPTALVRWVLLCALVFGVLGMHHLTGLTGGDSAHGGAHAAESVMSGPDCCVVAADPASPSHGDTHDLLAHLCLAVLAVGIGLLLILLSIPFQRSLPLPGRQRVAIDSTRAPPKPTLTLLCVSRQ
ncbi:hypothetical protein JOD54_004184 [Actinokineospora baliensis]|uniref:DUF6153 family protein n=1 Tax=Actinokineospora baliensis TaxID=547056 RepID=UPI00195A745A|nr:DUF6153 family protein [Actinokineospora baliensis]MBM7773980.1 hypothetical protein [Actinokineospora baliensis]